MSEKGQNPKVAVAVKEYLLDPASVGIELDTAGNPTSEGWKWVTPEMWKFRWNVADKVMVDEPLFFKDTDWYVDVTKSVMLARLWEKEPGMHMAEAIARMLEEYFEKQDIVIRPYDMLIGSHGGDEHAVQNDVITESWGILQVAQAQAGKERIRMWEDGKKVPLSDEDFKRLEKLALSRNIIGAIQPELTPFERKMYLEVQPTHPARYCEVPGASGMRANPDMYWWLPLGLRKLVELKREKLEGYKRELLQTFEPEGIKKLKEKIINAEMSVRSGEACIRWIKRHAEEARKAIPRMPDEKAKEILAQVAANCEWVAENPPRTFWEAMQLYWLCWMAYYQIEATCHSHTFRPDQVFWPWYKKDVLEEKTLSRQRAADIVACYAAKFHECSAPMYRFSSVGRGLMGTRDATVIVIGGQDNQGKDSCHDLTRLFLDVFDGYRLHYPDIKFRWHKNVNKDVFGRCVEVVRSGMGTPSLRNDEVCIPTLMDFYGMPLEEAREWAVVGCNTPGPTTNSKGSARRESMVLDVLKTVEFALFNGGDPEPGFEWFKSVETGDPTKFKDFEEFYQAWLKQWEWLSGTEVRLRNMCYRKFEGINRRPFLSLFYQRCLETGVDVNQLDVPKHSFFTIVGYEDIIDCLAGVKYCIYDKKMYTMEDLLKALKADWVGYEKMRKDFKKAPKFGNDDDYVDSIFTRATRDTYLVGLNLRDDHGGPLGYNALPLTLAWMVAPYIIALPNGRKRGDYLCDGGINPHAEFDKSGPWARMRSALKVDQAKWKAWIYNMKIDYDSVAGDAGLQKLTDYLETSLYGGQSQIQVNFLGREVYEDAQEHPEKYPYLSVRVSGYTAFFVGLPKDVQDSLIARVDHRL